MTKEITICDICGKEIEVPEFKIGVFSHFYDDVKLFKYEAIIDSGYRKQRRLRLDICKDCMTKLKDSVREV